MTDSRIAGVVRHVITAGAGAGFAATEDEVTRLIYAIAFIITTLWSWLAKKPKPAP